MTSSESESDDDYELKEFRPPVTRVAREEQRKRIMKPHMEAIAGIKDVNDQSIFLCTNTLDVTRKFESNPKQSRYNWTGIQRRMYCIGGKSYCPFHSWNIILYCELYFWIQGTWRINFIIIIIKTVQSKYTFLVWILEQKGWRQSCRSGATRVEFWLRNLWLQFWQLNCIESPHWRHTVVMVETDFNPTM